MCLQCQRDTCAVKHQGYVRSARGICVLGPPLCLALSVPLANRLRIFEEFFVFQQVCVCVCLATALMSRGCLRAATRPRHAPQSSRPIGCRSAAGVNWMGASTARPLIARRQRGGRGGRRERISMRGTKSAAKSGAESESENEHENRSWS